MTEQTVWCETCGERMVVGDWDECRHFECPMKNRPVDTGDELHRILGDALRNALPAPPVQP